MLKRLLVLLLVLGLVCGVASASTSSLRGTYKATIAGKPAALNGKWQLEFRPNGVLHVLRNGKLVVLSKTTSSGTRRFKVHDRSGAYACSRSEGDGAYTYKFVDRRLLFSAVKDKCVGRKLVFTTKPYTK